MTARTDHLTSWIRDVGLATTLLTRIPVPHLAAAMPSELARAQRAFPLVGAMIGLIIGLIDRSLLAMSVPPWLLPRSRSGLAPH